MNNITFAALENKFTLNNFNFLALRITNPIIPSNEVTNLLMVYSLISHVHSMTSLSYTCSCSINALIPLVCHEAILDTNVFNFVCLHLRNT